MRLATYDAGRGPRVGLIGADDTLVSLSDLIPEAPEDRVEGGQGAGGVATGVLRGGHGPLREHPRSGALP